MGVNFLQNGRISLHKYDIVVVIFFDITGKFMAAEEHDKLVVVKHNDLIRAAYRLTTIESRIVLACVAKINSKSHLATNHKISIHVSEIQDILNKDEINGGSFYIHLKEAVDRLAERWVYFLEPSKRSGEKKTRWVYTVEYIPTEAKIILSFSPDILPFLCELTDNFTKYQLSNILSFKASYSIRFYEMFKSWQNSEKTLTIEWLKEHLELEDTYDRIDNLQNRVIKPALLEINQHSDIRADYVPIKQGRKIIAFKFTFVCLSEKKEKKEIDKKNLRAERIEGVLKADLDKYANPGESYSQAATRLKAEQLMLEKTGKPTTLDILWK
jgi:plasmid replication initiation protein